MQLPAIRKVSSGSPRALVLVALALLALSRPDAHAAFTINLQEVGNDVVGTGSGSINTAGLSYAGTQATTLGALAPGFGRITLRGAASRCRWITTQE